MQYYKSKVLLLLLLLLCPPAEHSGGMVVRCVVGQKCSITEVSFCCCVPQLNILGLVVVCSGSNAEFYKRKLLLLGPQGEHSGGYGGDGV